MTVGAIKMEEVKDENRIKSKDELIAEEIEYSKHHANLTEPILVRMVAEYYKTLPENVTVISDDDHVLSEFPISVEIKPIEESQILHFELDLTDSESIMLNNMLFCFRNKAYDYNVFDEYDCDVLIDKYLKAHVKAYEKRREAIKNACRE